MALLKDEFVVNQKRVNAILEEMNTLSGGAFTKTPFYFAQSAWELIRETGLLPKIKDVKLIHHLFQIEEQISDGNNHLKVVMNNVQNLNKGAIVYTDGWKIAEEKLLIIKDHSVEVLSLLNKEV